MCLIIHQKDGDRLTKAEVVDIYTRNRDGFGVMWIENGVVQTWRTLPTSAKEAWQAYRWIAGYACVLHWRMCTHGAVSIDNAHPHVVVENTIAMVHNGVIPGYGNAKEGKSDTVEFVEQVLRPALTDPAIVHDETTQALIAKAIGSSSVVFATPTGFVRVGRQGVTHKDRWYSNTYAWSAPRELTFQTWRPVSVSTGRQLADGSWRFDRADDVDVPTKADRHTLWDRPQTLSDGTWADLCATLAFYLIEIGEDEFADDVLQAETDPTAAWIVDEAVDLLQPLCDDGYELQLARDTLTVVENWRASDGRDPWEQFLARHGYDVD